MINEILPVKSIIFCLEMWVIGQKVCVTNPNKLENL